MIKITFIKKKFEAFPNQICSLLILLINTVVGTSKTKELSVDILENKSRVKDAINVVELVRVALRESNIWGNRAITSLYTNLNKLGF